MKRVITYGTFDLLHYGHINLLRRARQLGDYLIVGLSTDEFNAIKGKKAYHSYEERKMMLEAIRYVDLVIPENEWGQKAKDIQEYAKEAMEWAVGAEIIKGKDGQKILAPQGNTNRAESAAVISRFVQKYEK